MDYLQYTVVVILKRTIILKVLNLIINGLPSIPPTVKVNAGRTRSSFKPYYKWITFNT